MLTTTSSQVTDVEDTSALHKRWGLVRAYGFSIASIHYLVTPGTYSELIKSPACSPLPNVGAHFAGLINLRGNLVPAYYLETYLSAVVPGDVAPYALLIGSVAQGAALMLQDKPLALDFGRLEPLQDLAMAPSAISHCVKHAYRFDDKIWLELSHDALFSTLAGP